MKQTPYWKKGRKEVQLSVGDKVCLVLKINDGSWNRLIKERKKAVAEGRGVQEDLDRAIRLREFEREHHIRFGQEGDSCDGFYWMPVDRKEAIC